MSDDDPWDRLLRGVEDAAKYPWVPKEDEAWYANISRSGWSEQRIPYTLTGGFLMEMAGRWRGSMILPVFVDLCLERTHSTAPMLILVSRLYNLFTGSVAFECQGTHAAYRQFLTAFAAPLDSEGYVQQVQHVVTSSQEVQPAFKRMLNTMCKELQGNQDHIWVPDAAAAAVMRDRRLTAWERLVLDEKPLIMHDDLPLGQAVAWPFFVFLVSNQGVPEPLLERSFEHCFRSFRHPRLIVLYDWPAAV